MTDLRTAAQQALEALEFFRDTAICSADTEAASEAITALKAALAQEPASDFERGFQRGWQRAMRDRDRDALVKAKVESELAATVKRLAEPVQEPVAWIQPDHLQKARVAPFLCRVEPTQRCVDFVPLYTAPPQRKPLTQEEIPALAEKAWTPSVYCDAEALLGTDGLVALVRAVEAKHGVKE